MEFEQLYVASETEKSPEYRKAKDKLLRFCTVTEKNGKSDRALIGETELQSMLLKSSVRGIENRIKLFGIQNVTARRYFTLAVILKIVYPNIKMMEIYRRVGEHFGKNAKNAENLCLYTCRGLQNPDGGYESVTPRELIFRTAAEAGFGEELVSALKLWAENGFEEF